MTTARRRRRRFALSLSVSLVGALVFSTLTGLAANAPGKISVTPTCGAAGSPAVGSGSWSITVNGTGWSPVDDARTIYLDHVAGAHDYSQPIVGNPASFSITFTPPEQPAGTYQIYVNGAFGNSNVVNFTVPCGPPGIQLSPNCGNPGAGVAVRGVNFNHSYAVTIDFNPGAGQVQLATKVNVAQDGTFNQNVTIPSTGPGARTIRAVDNAPAPLRLTADATFTIPCPVVPSPTPTSKPSPTPGATYTPQLSFTPVVGPPGLVAAMAGTGWPPGATINLAWTAGQGASPAGPASVTADASGNFNYLALVFWHDQLGPRNVTATTGTYSVGAVYLVTPGALEPAGGGSVATRIFISHTR